jgi:signal transduction histidine kinase
MLPLARTLERLRGDGVRRGDLALAALLTAFGVIELWVVDVGPKPVAVPAVVVGGAALYWRRVAPLTVAAVFFGAVAAESLLGVSLERPDAPLLMALVSVYTIGAYLALREALIGLAVALVGIWIGVASQTARGYSDFVFTLIVVAAGWLVGRGMHGRVRQTAELAERTLRLEQERESERRAAIDEERRRIARDLHDVIAHSVSVMVVQAGAAEDVFERDPAAVLEPIRAVQETGRAALVEISRLLGLLRDDGAELGLAPQPRLDDLGELAEQMRTAGLIVALRLEGEPRPLPLGVDLSVYRIAQEALTNTLKHADGAAAELVLRYRERDVELEVTDDGAGTENGHRGGHGLIGMRERMLLYGGIVEAGPQANGGWTVHARLPAGEDAS